MIYTVHEILQAGMLEWVAFPFSREIFPTQGSKPGLLYYRLILYRLSHREAQEYWNIPSPAAIPDPGIKQGSPALQVDS